MKTLNHSVPFVPWLCLAAFVGAAFWPDSAQAQLFKKTPEKLDEKIDKAAERLDLIQGNPDTRIPTQVLANARGVIIVHQFKAGIGIGAQGGGGVAMVKDSRTGQWSPPAFVANAEGSYGWQIGAQNADTVFVIMQEEGMKILRQGGMKLGVDVRATAGPATTGAEAAVDNVDSPILVYSNQAGLYAGVAIEGGGIIPAQKNNLTYYGISMQEVLFGSKAKMTPVGRKLANKLVSYSSSQPAAGATFAPNPGLQPYQPAPQGVPGQYQPQAPTGLSQGDNRPGMAPTAPVAQPITPNPATPPVTYPPISEVEPATSRNPVTEP